MKNLLFTISVWISAGCLVTFAQDNRVEVSYSDAVNDYTPVVREILKEHSHGNFVLVFEEAVYPFFPERAKDKYLTISNNDNGNRRVVFDFEGMEGVKVEGKNTTFLFYGKLIPFVVFDAVDINISGITIDYDHPFVFEGTVVANDTIARTFDIKVHTDNLYEIQGDRLFFKGYDWSSELGENIVFDPKTRGPIHFTAKYEHNYHESALSAKSIGEGIVRFSGIKAQQVPPVGSVFTDKGPHGKNREIPGFVIQRSQGIILSDVTIHKSGAMGLIAEKSKNITLDGFHVMVPEGSDRMISASADATHFINCSGKIVLQNCRFESMLDDATNVHGTYMYVKDVLKDGKLGIAFGHFQQEGFDFGNVGDRIRFVDRKTLMSVAEGGITGIEKVNENYYILSSDVDLATLPNPRQLAVDNRTHQADVHIKNCSVKYNRARSLLISTLGKVLIENNYFASMMAGIRICGDSNYWFESGDVAEVVVRNNTFEDLGIGGHAPQAILQIDPVIPKEQRSKGFYHGKIVFENNLVRTFDNQIVYALSVDSLILRNNVFVDSKSQSAIYPELSVIDVQHCNNLVLEGNDFTNWKPNATISILDSRSVVDKDKKLKIVENPNKYFYQN